MKTISVFLAILIAFSCGCTALAAELGVVAIGGDDTQTETVSLDDIKIDDTATIPLCAEITPTDFSYADILKYWSYNGTGLGSYESGTTAEYACLKVTIMNLKVKPMSIYKALSDVVLTYDDKYQYSGWVYQYDTDPWMADYDLMDESVMEKKDYMPIGPLFEGYFVIGGTIPNTVVNSERPLRLEFTLDGNAVTYHIRK